MTAVVFARAGSNPAGVDNLKFLLLCRSVSLDFLFFTHDVNYEGYPPELSTSCCGHSFSNVRNTLGGLTAALSTAWVPKAAP